MSVYPGKIVVDLQGVRVDRDQRFRPRIEVREIEHAVHQVRAQIIGDHQLLHQPHADQEQRASAVGRGQKPPLLELIDQRRDARDRSGQSGREERNGGQVQQIAARALRVAAIEVDRVGQRLKNVKRKTERQRPAPHRSGVARRIGPRPQEKRHVLEKGQHSQVHQDARGHQRFAYARIFGILQTQADEVIAGGRSGNQDQVIKIPPRVKEIIGEQDHGEPRAVERHESRAHLAQRPVKKEDGSQKDEVNGGRE